MLEKQENVSMGGKKEAEEKIYLAQIERTFEVELPPTVIDALNLDTKDNVQFYEDDNGQICLKKA